MIDRKARDKFAELLRHFYSGQIDNFEFESRLPESDDLAIYEIWWQAGWPLYDDFKTHKLKGDWRIPDEHKRELARVILFLKSDYEYLWPKKTGIKACVRGIVRIFTFGFFPKEYNGFDRNIWPFTNPNSLESANNNPPFCKTIE